MVIRELDGTNSDQTGGVWNKIRPDLDSGTEILVYLTFDPLSSQFCYSHSEAVNTGI